MINSALKLLHLPSRDTFLVLILSVVLIIGLFLLQGHVGFNLWDEGFLWYGVQRVMQGEVPLRDFMAYDPGRYYWSALLMNLSGDDGILALRGSIAVFQAIGLFIGLRLIFISDKKQDIYYLLLSALILVVWMYPRHKLFDITLSIMLIGALTYLVAEPVGKRFFYSGVLIGFIAVFGRNHGVYGLIAVFLATIWLSIGRADITRVFSNAAIFIFGVSAGFSPLLLMMLFVPEFGAAFLDSIRFLFEAKSTNLTLPVPWPWTLNFSQGFSVNYFRDVLIGCFFIALLAFAAISVSWILRQKIHNNKVKPEFIAAAFLGIPYAHFAYSRADISHLAQAIFPLLIGCLILLAGCSNKVRWTGVFILGLASLVVMPRYHPAWQCYARIQCLDVDISGDTLLIDRSTAADINLLRELEGKYAPVDQSFLVVPFWPGAYALLGSKSPVWEIFPLYPRSEEFEKNEISKIASASPEFVLIDDTALDGREELRFRNTHPLTYQYIRRHFVLLTDLTKPAYQIYIANNGADN